MSLAKARDLMRLAEMAAARHHGVSLAEIAEAYGADHRTAQRMARALQGAFPDVEIRTDDDRRRRRKLRDPGLARFQGIRDGELTALDNSIRRAEREGAGPDVAALAALRDRLLACIPAARPPRRGRRRGAARGPGLRRPGPSVRAAPGVLETITEALKGPFLLADHLHRRRRRRRRAPRRTARRPARHALPDRPRRGSRPHPSPLPGRPYPRRAPARLNLHDARAFGSSQDKARYGEVVWRFAPAAAPTAREFVFHPGQRFEDHPRRPRPSGWLEMAWHLYQ